MYEWKFHKPGYEFEYIANCVIVNVNIKNNYILTRRREDNYKLHEYGNESEYDSELCKHGYEYTYNCVNIRQNHCKLYMYEAELLYM